MESISWVLLATAISLLMFKLLNNPHRKKTLPPGPRSWPLIGNLNLIGHLPHQSLHKLSQTYGELMYLKFGSVPVVVASSPEMAKQILRTHDRIFASRPQLAAGRYTTYNYNDIAWAPFGPFWAQGRKIYLNKIFSSTKLDSCEHIRVEEIRSFVSRLHALSGSSIVLKDQVSRANLSVISIIVLGRKYFSESRDEKEIVTFDEFREMLDELFLLNGVLNVGDWMPWLEFMDLQGYVKRMKAVCKRFDRFHDHVLEEHRARMKAEGGRFEAKDMVDLLLEMADDPNLEVKLDTNGVKGFTQFDDRSIVLKDHVSRANLSVISRIVLGRKYFSESRDEKEIVTFDEFREMLDELFLLNGVLNIGDWMPWLGFMDLQGYVKRMKVVCKRFDRFHDHVLEEHRARMKAEGEGFEAKDMVDLLLEMADDPNLEVKLNTNGVKGFTQDLIAGGTDTASTTVEWAMSELIKQPHLIKKATDELDRVIGRERWVEEADFPNLPFIDSILKETMRLHPVAVLLAPHLALEDCPVAGYDIAKGTTVFINTWSIGRDSNIWDDPLSFRPERFLGRDVDVKGQHFELLPFGSGRRMCPGYNLGLKMMRSALGNLLHGFHWNLGQDMKMEDIDMEEVYGLSTQRKLPLVVVPEPRLPAHLYN